MSIAENRHHAKRVKRNRKHYVSAWNGNAGPRPIGMTAITPKRCGCWMCSNQRQSFGEPFSDTKRKAACSLNEEDWGV